MRIACCLAVLSMISCATAFELFGFELPQIKMKTYKRTRGEPKMHEPVKKLLDCPQNTIVEDGHPCSKKFILQRTSYQGRVQTDTPIYGILTQPYFSDNENYNAYSDSMANSYVLTSHVQFLEQAGARVVPVNYRMRPQKLTALLSQLNGLYIPGDSKDILQNARYMDTIFNILTFGQQQNAQSNQHFPIVAVSYGYLALVQSSVKLTGSIQDVPSDLFDSPLLLNLRLTPDETYVFDGLDATTLDDQLNTMTFYNELEMNINVQNFLQEKQLSRVFVPVATYNQDGVAEIEEEFIAIMEGSVFPFFGFAFSLEKIQYNFDLNVDAKIDHQIEAVQLAQKIANLIVDEARLNGNSFKYSSDEADALINNYDTYLTEKYYDNTLSGLLELYLFQ